MVIDMHHHLFTRAERYRGLGVLGATPPAGGQGGEGELIPDARQRAKEILQEMESAGIATSVIVLDDPTARYGEGNLSIEGENRRQAEIGRTFPGKLIPFAGIDPRRPRALELFRRCIDEWGIRGLKLNCGIGYFYPYDPACLPLYELAGQREVPILFHTGPAPAPSHSETSRPIHLDAVAADFPKTTFIMAHAGQEAYWLEAMTIAHWKRNVILELSGWQRTYLFDPKDLVSVVARMKHFVGIDRIVWGSDFPAYRTVMSLKDWVEAFLKLPALGQKHGYNITEEDVNSILSTNAQRILRLNHSDR